MAKVKNEIELDDDDFLADDDESPETEIVNSKISNQTRRRQIDDLLEERRLQKQLADFDFD